MSHTQPKSKPLTVDPFLTLKVRHSSPVSLQKPPTPEPTLMGQGKKRKKRQTETTRLDLTQLGMAQQTDNAVIEARLFDEVTDARRKRSLKFRAKMRDRRVKLHNDPFHRLDRTFKNENKVSAAKRRKRTDTGKFNMEEHPVDSPQSPPDGEASSEVSQYRPTKEAEPATQPMFQVHRITLPAVSMDCVSLPCPVKSPTYEHLSPLAKQSNTRNANAPDSFGQWMGER